MGRFQYTGQAWLAELGMYYYKARMYSPTLGRFMQTDPIGYADGMNAYAYVGNDPVNGRDPSGTYTYCVSVNNGPSHCSETQSGDQFSPLNLNGLGSVLAQPDEEVVVRARRKLTVGAGVWEDAPSIGCQSFLPNGKTVADYIKNANSAIDRAENPLREFLNQVGSGGAIDFKNNFRGQADSFGGASYLADAGNFAYGAIAAHRYGSWEIGRQVMFFGAHTYAFAHNKANVTPVGTIFPTDASAARQAGRGFDARCY